MTTVEKVKKIIVKQETGIFQQQWKGSVKAVPYRWVIGGDTFDYRRTLKRCGGEYNGPAKTWHFDTEDLPDAVLQIASGSAAASEPDFPLFGEDDSLTNDDPSVTPPPALVEKIVEKIVEVPVRVEVEKVVEVEKIVTVEVEKEVIVLKNLTHKRKPRKVKATQRPQRKPIKLQPDIVKPSYWDRLVRYLTPGRSRPAIALVGPTGNGKTTIAEAVCESLDISYLVIDCNDRMEASDLIGAMTYHPDKGEVWRDGPVTKAFREGKAVILNEYDTLDPRTGMSLQSAFQAAGPKKKSRYITLSGNPDEDRVYPKGDCPLILTMNTYGNGANRQYTGRNTLDAANLDRISVIVTNYENEEEILTRRGFNKDNAYLIVSWARSMREKVEKEMMRVTISNRVIGFIAETVEWDRLSFEQALEEEFFMQIDPSDATLLRPKATFGARKFGS